MKLLLNLTSYGYCAETTTAGSLQWNRSYFLSNSHHRSNLASSINDNGARGATTLVKRLRLHLFDNTLPFYNFAEDDVLAIKVGGRRELGSGLLGTAKKIEIDNIQ